MSYTIYTTFAQWPFPGTLPGWRHSDLEILFLCIFLFAFSRSNMIQSLFKLRKKHHRCQPLCSEERERKPLSFHFAHNISFLVYFKKKANINWINCENIICMCKSMCCLPRKGLLRWAVLCSILLVIFLLTVYL